MSNLAEQIQDSQELLEKKRGSRTRAEEKYGKDLAKQYGLSDKQFEEIGDEGMVKNWPFPKCIVIEGGLCK